MTQHATPPPSGEWQPTNPPAPQPPPEQKSWFARHKVLTAILALFAFVVVLTALGGGDETTSAATASSPTVAAEEPGTEPTEEEPTQEQSTEDESAAEETEATAEEPAEPDAPGIGDAVRDGKFEFVVTAVEDGGTEVGGEFLSESAQGRFHLVHLRVTNIGDEAQMLLDSNQQVRDEQGRTFESNSMAAMVLEDNEVWLEDINPGNTVEGTLVFDMPEGSAPVEIELHDSAFSGGVTVTLS